ncbi:uncharacterized protein LOC126899565 [Daktulosphaira vitifoliae]|uniref:uncharacterized protein LOC126899565 n=1 Tax=Daktulosphaira vitifoliae TaxID=58002 RepID=UPI0021AA6718|nr:uncharacterized protein LOC126899565 [Daktulosphaira vitifoliae]
MVFQVFGKLLYALNILTETPSDNQYNMSIQNIEWINKYHDENIYSKKIINLLNEVETYEFKNQNTKRTFYFGENEIKLLINKCNENFNCLKEKSKAIVKYKQKIETVQCINAAYIEFLLPDINKVLSSLPVKYISKDTVRFYRQIIARMLSLVYMANVPAHNWLWNLYLRLLEVEHQCAGMLTCTNKFSEIQFKDDLTQHLNLCMSYKYLPNTKNQWLSEKIKYEENIRKIHLTLYDNNNSKDSYLNIIYSFAEQFEVKYLTIFNIHSHYSLIFNKTSGMKINWENTKLLIIMEKERISNKQNNSIIHPFNSTKYLDMIRGVIEAKLLFLTWRHLIVLQVSIKRVIKGKSNAYNANKNMITYWNLLVTPLTNTIYQLSINNQLLKNIINYLRIKKTPFCFSHEFRSTIAIIINQLENTIKNDLSDLGVCPHEIQELFIIPRKLYIIDEYTNVNTSRYGRYVHQIQSYVNSIQNAFQPINFDFITFFKSGKSKITETFFMY